MLDENVNLFSGGFAFLQVFNGYVFSRSFARKDLANSGIKQE